MDQEINSQETFDNGEISLFKKYFRRLSGQVYLTENEIEAQREDYWVCKCGELIEINDYICWHCDASRPDNYVHPGKEEVRKKMLEDNKSNPFWVGVIFFLGAIGVLIRGYIYDHHHGTFPDIVTILFAGIFILLAVIMIVYWLGKKVKE